MHGTSLTLQTKHKCKIKDSPSKNTRDLKKIKNESVSSTFCYLNSERGFVDYGFQHK